MSWQAVRGNGNRGFGGTKEVEARRLEKGNEGEVGAGNVCGGGIVFIADAIPVNDAQAASCIS